MNKNIIIIAVAILAILGLSGVAAQALAPIDLKPTEIVKRVFYPNTESQSVTAIKPNPDKVTANQTETVGTNSAADPTQLLKNPNIDAPVAVKPKSTSALVVEPININQMQKTEFDTLDDCGDNSPQNTANQPAVKENVVSYSIKPDDLYFKNMIISNQEYAIYNQSKIAATPTKFIDLKPFQDLFLGDNSSTLGDLNAVKLPFRNACGGYASTFASKLSPVKFGDQAVALLTLDGQEYPAMPTVKIYAKKSDNIILLNQAVISETEFKALIKSCGYDSNDVNADFSKFDDKCFRAKLDSPEFIQKANQKAKDLTQFFALK